MRPALARPYVTVFSLHTINIWTITADTVAYNPVIANIHNTIAYSLVINGLMVKGPHHRFSQKTSVGETSILVLYCWSDYYCAYRCTDNTILYHDGSRDSDAYNSVPVGTLSLPCGSRENFLFLSELIDIRVRMPSKVS